MRFLLLLIAGACLAGGRTAAAQASPPALEPERSPSAYVLGPQDQLAIRVRDLEEIGAAPVRIDAEGYIRLLYLGRVQAAGRSLEQLRSELTERLRRIVLEPDVTIAITEFRSQPVSVLGSVRMPGVHQLQGSKTLVEVLSLAGGLDSAAGPTVKITRRAVWGRIPLKNAVLEPEGRFSVAEVRVKSILDAANPEENIPIRPEDVISVPRADMIYVVGEVVKPGGFALNDQDSMPVLQAVALAGGLSPSAAPGKARILRPSARSVPAEIAIDIKAVLRGRLRDVPLRRDDILFVPSSGPKRAAGRILDTAIRLGTGMIYLGR